MWRPHRWISARLHRALFLWFGATIACSAAVFLVVLSIGHVGHGSWSHVSDKIVDLVSREFSRNWYNDEKRTALADDCAATFGVLLELRNTDGTVLSRHGQGPCSKEAPVIHVADGDGRLVGEIRFCRNRGFLRSMPVSALFGLIAAALVLWGATGLLARKLAWPLRKVAAVAKQLGDGNLQSRIDFGAAGRLNGEVQILARSINSMAERIEKQLTDQKQLLAAVSHELRTPLGHVQVLLETAEEQQVDPDLIEELRKEIIEMDALVGQLLANSRLEFDALQRQELDAGEVGADALKRHGLSSSALELTGTMAMSADATLLSRALANLIRNAETHGRGLVALQVCGDEEETRFEVYDRGDGFSDTASPDLFDPFQRGSGGGESALGLGLALVKRIAVAHRGRAWASNDREGGARVGFSVGR